MNGVVFNNQRFSLQDGPGIRTTVFLKGCPLHCAWCHNPESQHREREIAFCAEKCIQCGQCVAVCPAKAHVFSESGHVYRRESCTLCGKCTEVCYMQALEQIGRETTADEVFKEVWADREFYVQSGGGMTISGGEPLAQPEFTLQLARTAREHGIHVCIETCGMGQWENLCQLANFVDLFLYDYKVTDSKKHKIYTGVGNELLLSNLQKLDEMGAATVLRCPMIPEISMDDGHIAGIIRQANRLAHCVEIDLEPYHPLGISKCEQIGKNSQYQNTEFLDRKKLEPIRIQIQEKVQIPVKII